jgi:hypothetical protein
MTYLQVDCGTATLTPPTVSGQHLIAELFKGFGVELQPGTLRTGLLYLWAPKKNLAAIQYSIIP